MLYGGGIALFNSRRKPTELSTYTSNLKPSFTLTIVN